MLEQNQAELIRNKTEQSLRIMQQLWEERIRVLNEYFDQRRGITFFFMRGKPATQERLAKTLAQLETVNRREQHLIVILRDGSRKAVDILSRLEPSSEQERILTSDATAEFRNTFADLEHTLVQCRDVMVFQESFLKKEADLLVNADDRTWNDYIAEMQVVANKMRAMTDEHRRLENTRIFLQKTNVSIIACRNAIEKKGPTAYIEPSIYSAITRVFAANIVSALLMHKDIRLDATFFKFTSITASLVFLINFGDYYYNWFSWMTGKMLTLRKSAAKALHR
ncbi:TPA: hypothetical protein HA251_08140 [Candidatus Woesearchaeota archaeon]|nr:hypothetical protein [Candidatus Woesearchaeota archaeon]